LPQTSLFPRESHARDRWSLSGISDDATVSKDTKQKALGERISKFTESLNNIFLLLNMIVIKVARRMSEAFLFCCHAIFSFFFTARPHCSQCRALY